MKHVEAVDEPRPGLPRVVEVVFSSAGLIVVAPVLVVAVVAIAAESRGSPLFLQERVGCRGRRFRIWKLRTMRQGDGPEVTAAGDSRVTRVGRILRRLKLDELPQLWNVVKGEMSLVGPRPEVPSFVDPSDPLWRIVLAARPGMTDPVSLGLKDEEELLSECSGNRESFYREILQPFKLKGYVAYLQRRTAASDLRVLGETVLVAIGILKKPGVRLQDLGVDSGS